MHSSVHSSDNIIRNVKGRTYSSPMYVHKHQLYLLEQHRESLEIWSAIIKTNTEGKSLIIKLNPGLSEYF